jgi:sterol desaturase/sphingolipid hydroxylase (fatty acid hydroxylase superfamily)
MHWQALTGLVGSIVYTLGFTLPYLAGAAIVFAVLSWISPCNAGRPWWHKRGLATDLAYWVFIPVLARYARIGFTVLFTMALLGITSADAIANFYAHGHGPLAALPLWLQIAFYLLVSDVLLYWIHRAFHGSALWRFHAVHHSSVDLEWISAARFHPINIIFGTTLVDVLMLVAGIKPDVFFFLIPFTTLSSVFVHANLDWTLGPLKYLLVSPVFHRWHHTLPDGSGARNFATNFAFLDLLFGTFHMPEGTLPEHYGILETDMPDSLGMQVLYPLMH